MITAIDYDVRRLELRVTFADGRTFVHRGVPDSIHAALKAAKEPASYYLATVRGQYPHSEI